MYPLILFLNKAVSLIRGGVVTSSQALVVVDFRLRDNHVHPCGAPFGVEGVETVGEVGAVVCTDNREVKTLDIEVCLSLAPKLDTLLEDDFLKNLVGS